MDCFAVILLVILWPLLVVDALMKPPRPFLTMATPEEIEEREKFFAEAARNGRYRR